MIVLVLVLLLIVAIIGVFIPEKYVPKQKPKAPWSKYSDEYWTGLPWMGGKKKKKKYFWDD